jgi:hypothetical protein
MSAMYAADPLVSETSRPAASRRAAFSVPRSRPRAEPSVASVSCAGKLGRPPDGPRAARLGAALGDYGGGHTRRVAVAAVVVDDRVAILAARARRDITVRRCTATEDDDALLARAESSEHDHVVRSMRPLPDELHALRIHTRGDPEDVRRPSSAHGRPPLRCRRRWAIAPLQPLRGGVLPSGRRCRSCTTLKLESHSRCRAILPREETARGSTRNKDDCCQDRCPPPASRPRLRRRRRDVRTRGLDRDGRRQQPRLLARLRKERARSLRQHMVDECELGADRAQVFRDGRHSPQRQAHPGRRALDDVWPRHADSLTSLGGDSQMGRKRSLFASVSIRNRPK